MDERLTTRWRVVLLAGTFASVTAAFHFAAPTVAPYAGFIGVLPIAIAAWFFGARVAIGVTVLEGISNLGLIGRDPPTSGSNLMVDVIEGAALAIIAISAGAAQGAKRRLATALATDVVTGFANRQAFIHEVDRLLSLNTNVTVGMLDLVDIADVNETFGYDVGDDLLAAIAMRLRDAFGSGPFLAKGIRDRFAVIWPALDMDDESLALRLLAIVEAPFIVRGAELRPNARASVARRDGTRAQRASELVRAASTALEPVPGDGRSWRTAAPADPTTGVSRLELLSGLSAAIANNELRLHYQPIIDLTTGSLQSLEALVRWQHPTRGLVMPLEFIPLAEQSGLIVPLTAWVLDEALRQSSDWADQAMHVQVSVNIGAKTFAESAGLATIVQRLLTKHAVKPASLCLEVTETDVMTDPAHAATVLADLKALGVRVEMDDFGTGYSSLAYLQKLPVDGIKIDRSFIAPLLHDLTTSAIVRAAIDLSHALGLDAVAEGVEDEAVLQRLREMGCDAAQGYVIARPMRGPDVFAWVADFKRRLEAADVPQIVATRMTGPTIEPRIEPAPAQSRGTVLVVDDEHPFRLAAHRILSAQGYRVLHAATASEALRICTELKGSISLLLTDVFLTDWKGNDLAAHLRRTYPDMRIMFMSGDAGEGKKRAGTDVFLAKPFSNRELVDRVAWAIAS
jgi:EAL domain-containing protein (putative c-di-GMP-specific phosphodiesterase class I)/GGDEF domain-containing protein/CheY-like chemotaxis protein